MRAGRGYLGGGWCSAQRIPNSNDCRWQSYLNVWLRRRECASQRFPVAVPDICLRRQSALASVDRCPALTSLHPPPAALGSLSLSRLLWVLSCSAARKYPAGGSHITNSHRISYELQHGTARAISDRPYGLKRSIRFKLQLWLSALISNEQKPVSVL